MNPRRTVAVLLALILAALIAGATVAPTPAYAAVVGSNKVVHGPDAGYDPPFRIRCKKGDRNSDHWLAEGQGARRFSGCKDVYSVFVGPGEELWRKRVIGTTATGKPITDYVKLADRTGEHVLARVIGTHYEITVRQD